MRLFRWLAVALPIKAVEIYVLGAWMRDHFLAVVLVLGVLLVVVLLVTSAFGWLYRKYLDELERTA